MAIVNKKTTKIQAFIYRYRYSMYLVKQYKEYYIALILGVIIGCMISLHIIFWNERLMKYGS